MSPPAPLRSLAHDSVNPQTALASRGPPSASRKHLRVPRRLASPARSNSRPAFPPRSHVHRAYRVTLHPILPCIPLPAHAVPISPRPPSDPFSSFTPSILTSSPTLRPPPSTRRPDPIKPLTPLRPPRPAPSRASPPPSRPPPASCLGYPSPAADALRSPRHTRLSPAGSRWGGASQAEVPGAPAAGTGPDDGSPGQRRRRQGPQWRRWLPGRRLGQTAGDTIRVAPGQARSHGPGWDRARGRGGDCGSGGAAVAAAAAAARSAPSCRGRRQQEER